MISKRMAAASSWYRARRRAVQRWAHIVVPAAILVGAATLRISESRVLEYFEQKSFDALQILKPRPYESAPVRIIDIDDETLARLGQWPWPRVELARLVRRLGKLGAATVAFDAVFAEKDRTSPSSLVHLWKGDPRAKELTPKLLSLPDHDRAFAAALASVPTVMGVTMVEGKNATMPLVKAKFAYGGSGPLAFLRIYSGAVRNLPELEEAAAGVGAFLFQPDHDLMVRKAPMLVRKDSTLIPALAAEAIRVVQGEANIKVKAAGGSGESSYGGMTGITHVRIGAYTVPTDDEGRIWMYYTMPAPERVIPAWRLYEKDFDAATVEGTIAFIGTSAAGLRDLRPTPLNPVAAGVEVHANAAEQILLGRFLHRPDWATGAEFLFIVLLGGLLIVVLPWLGAAWGAWIAASFIAVALATTWYQFSRHGLLIDPVLPCLSILGIYMSSSLISYLKSETERRQVKGAFSRYMSPTLVEQLAKHPEKLKLGGETRTMTFHFCDIRGFTTISERYDPHGLTQLMNRFLTPMTETILEHQGVIDKYIGDCIMAFWNAPLDDAQHAQNACRAALKMHARLRALNESWRAEAEGEGREYVPIKIGTGLNTGTCVVGNMGSDMRFDYSVLGDAVNLASRLEGQSKSYGVDIVIGPDTREAAPEFATLELDLIRVKGKTLPVRIFTLLGGAEVKESLDFQAVLKSHDAMLSAYRGRRWDDARGALAECRKSGLPLHGLWELYERRIDACVAQPPAEGWDGVFVALSK